MKIVITGGHFSPAYAVIQKLKKTDDVLVIGRKYAFEGDKNETYEFKICEKNNIPFKILNAGRLQRKLTKHTIPSMLKFPGGVISALSILNKFKPDVVVTFGGYIGLPVATAAKILKIPVVLHEQVQRAGLSSKLISKYAHVVCISFNSSRAYFKNKNIILTGNPIRPELFQTQDNMPQFKTSLPLIYITGGSTGSHAINEAIANILPELLTRFFVVHQTGNSAEFNDFDRLRKIQESLSDVIKKNYIVSHFFAPEEVSFLLQNANLTISRAGINTVMELMATGAVSLLIPLPYGQLGEQKDNALLLKKTGLAEYIDQDNLSSEGLLLLINDMIKEQKRYKDNQNNVQEYIHKDAAEKIIEQIYLYGKSGNQRTRKIQTPKT